MLSLFIGFACSSLITIAAYMLRSLSISGVIAAIGVGTIMYSLGSLPWYGVLICFFVFSSLLSKIKSRVKTNIEQQYEKTGRRDAGQVLANGGLATLFCAGNAFYPHPSWWFAFLGVMAAVTADTWATEIGGFSRQQPRSILSGKRVEPGTSGGITWLGLGASWLGGMVIGGAAIVLNWITPAGDNIEWSMHWLWIAGLSGLMGSLTDSLIGAKWQRMFQCAVCHKVTERQHHCGRPSRYYYGVVWMNNDAVNFASSLVGALVAWMIWQCI